MDDGEGSEEQQLCGEYEMYTLARFLFLSLSSVLALFGAAANAMLFVLFSSRAALARANTPATLYPRVLALLDASICAGYILLFGADAAVIYLRIRPLFLLYHLYIVPAFVLSRICQLAIPYMLIFATLERLVWISSGKIRNSLLRRMYSVKGRHITVAFTLGACAVLRLPTYWATTVHEYPQCDDFFRTKTAGPADWVMNSRFFYVYDFHLLSIAQTVFPFFVLVAFNLVVVRRVSQLSPRRFSSALLRLPPPPTETNEQKVSFGRASGGGRRSSFIHRLSLNGPVRSAVYTMVCIVCSYLLSNCLHLALTALERSNSALLRDPVDPTLASTFHTVFSDIVSFVYMFTSAARPLIYFACNPSTRAQIRRCFRCNGRKSRQKRHWLTECENIPSWSNQREEKVPMEGVPKSPTESAQKNSDGKKNRRRKDSSDEEEEEEEVVVL
ncbi:hypothetical protein niasHS_011106 [Heterodera schachtii]|uniref:G-protein coupled receptors family 1 profile domain-containing protein n=1 Tax=Heterodera schachtii TaxID=97005 RepID=A0ABD2ITI9_HETSC